MINPVYKIQIDDLTIRCAELKDATKQKEAVDDSLDHLHEFSLWSHHEPETIVQKEIRLLRWRKNYLENKDYTVVLFRKEKFIGSAGLHNRLGRNALEIGYWVRSDEINKGVATKVSFALTLLGLKYIKVDEVEIHHNIKNIASSKIPQKLKYSRLGNYFSEDKNENAKWIIDDSIFDKEGETYAKLFEKIQFFDIKGNFI